MTRHWMMALAMGAGLMTGAGIAQAQMMDHGDGAMMHEAGDKAGLHMKKHMQMHGPTGVMGRHLLPEGKVMLGYSLGMMRMEGLASGTTGLDPIVAATSVPNRFFGLPMQPRTLRVIPEEMDMQMHMFSAMYGASDRVTLMAMVPYVEKSMTATTYAGPAGTRVLGSNKMRSEGLGDVTVGAVIGLHKKGRGALNMGIGASLPTGSISERGRMLSPMGTTPEMRMAYGMQLGSGTLDLKPSLTWTSGKGRLNWGAQVSGVIRTGDNAAGYTLGDVAAVTAWASYKPSRWFSYSARLEATSQGRIRGIDPFIRGPMPGSDPANYGGEAVIAYLGAELTPPSGALKGHRIGLEIGLPAYQKVNGVQLRRDWSAMMAWRKAF